MTTIDLVPHMDAGDRTKWQGDQNVRPLTDLGRRQAAAMASVTESAGAGSEGRSIERPYEEDYLTATG